MARRTPLSNPHSAIDILKEDGGVILTGFTTPSEVEKVNADAAPYINAIVKDRLSRGLPQGVARCHRLFGRSETAREIWLQQPDLLKIFNHFLSTVSQPYNFDDGVELATDPIISAATTLDNGPGVEQQGLHRDDYIWQQTHHGHQGNEYALGSDVGMAVLVPGSATTVENGATLFIPGSHMWDHSRRPKTEEAVSAEMSLGEAFIFLSSTVHGGGANSTSKSRPVHGFFFCRSYIRPEENQYLWWTREEVRKWSPAAQKQAGYILDNPYLGHSDEKNPIDAERDQDIRG